MNPYRLLIVEEKETVRKRLLLLFLLIAPIVMVMMSMGIFSERLQQLVIVIPFAYFVGLMFTSIFVYVDKGDFGEELPNYYWSWRKKAILTLWWPFVWIAGIIMVVAYGFSESFKWLVSGEKGLGDSDVQD